MQSSVASLVGLEVPVLPVIEVTDAGQILPIAEALAAGGINALEITLRTPAGLPAIELAKKTFPEAIVCAGTVTNVDQLQAAADAGAEFAVTPGISESLLQSASNLGIDILPGVATPSDVMQGLCYDLQYFKLFPASVVGGIGMLNALAGPFPGIKFCPTGGLNRNNFCDYLALDNVFCVGGSWMIARSNGAFNSEASEKAAAQLSAALAASR